MRSNTGSKMMSILSSSGTSSGGGVLCIANQNLQTSCFTVLPETFVSKISLVVLLNPTDIACSYHQVIFLITSA